MNKTKVLFFTTLVLLLTSSVVFSAEYYLSFEISEQKELDVITKLVSISHLQDNTVFAYANDKQLEAFEQAGYTFKLLPHPSSLFDAPMAKSVEGLADWDTYPTYSQYDSIMYQFAADYPNLCVIEVIDTTYEGHELLVAKISGNVNIEENEPEVLYTSSMHGDEITGYVLMLRFIDHLLSNYGVSNAITDMVDSMEIWINPLANPDGTYNAGDHTVSGATRGNSNFIDINRNFLDPDDGPNPDGNAYQLETLAMMAFAEANHFVISANFHGGAEVVNYPWDTWSRLHPDNSWWVDVSRAYADTVHQYAPSGYMDGFVNGITNGYAWYPVAGGRQDYMNYYHGCREVTIELSDTKLIPASQLPAHWNYNYRSFINYLRAALFGIRGVVTDSLTGLPLDATINVIGLDNANDSSHVYTDPAVGDYHRMISAGTYSIEYISPGYVTKTVSGISVSDGSITVVDVQLAPISSDPVLVLTNHDALSVNPGDNSVPVYVTLRNDGGGNAVNAVGTLATADSYITITQNSSTYPTITALGGTAVSNNNYLFDVSSSCPEQYTADFEVYVTADGGFADTVQFSIDIGLLVEQFETGDFASYPWAMSGTADWIIDGTTFYEGNYSSKSGNISDNQQSTMSLTVESSQAGAISFYYKTSSENNWDFLRFYIDNVEIVAWAGLLDWTYVSYPVSAGTHTYKWEYDKDGSQSHNLDCAWVDFITLPLGSSFDSDNDGIADGVDNCPLDPNAGQEDADADGVGDLCDICPGFDDAVDSDGDLVPDGCDICAGFDDAVDSDGDAVPDGCDICAGFDDAVDSDGDAVPDGCDICAGFDDAVDSDGDAVPDGCDACAGFDDALDADSDLVPDSCDNCVMVYNPDQADANSNGIGDLCDFCCTGIRGNIDGDAGDNIDIADLVYFVEYSFGNPIGPAPLCFEEGDVDGSLGLDIADIVYLVAYMFGSPSGPAPLSCQ